MHIALCAPASLEVIEAGLPRILGTTGYPFPMTAALAKAYARQGHSVTLISSGQDIVEPVRARSDGVDVVVVPARLRARARAMDLFKDERRRVAEELLACAPDVIHAHWTYEFAMAAQESGLPTVVTVHDWAPAILRHARDPYRAARLVMQMTAIKRSSYLTAPSEYIAQRVRRWYRKTCVVVPNAIVPPESPNIQRRRPRTESNIRVAMLNATGGPGKNLETAIEAWATVHARYPRARLEVAGSPFVDDGALACWAKMKGLASGVAFVGGVPATDVLNWLSSNDVFLHPSLEESFGMVLLEAMSAGLPIVAGRSSGAVAEVVGEAGLLIDVRRSREIAHALLGLIESAPARQALMDKGRERASEFNIDRVAGDYINHLERCMAQSGASE